MDKVKELMTEDIYLFGEITDAEACKMVQMVDRIRLYGDKVRLWICSMGGDVGGALAIHDALKRFPGSEAIATGNCQSAALLVLLGAERRWATPNTIFFNHGILAPDRPDVEFPVEMGFPAVKQLCRSPLGYFDSQQAIEYGLVGGLWCVQSVEAQKAASG